MKYSYLPRKADLRMEQLALRELKKVDPQLVCGEPCSVPIEEIIENYYGISIEYHYMRKTLRTLGQMIFDGGHAPIYDMEKQQYTLIDVPPKTMLIDIRLTQDRRYANRLRFSYAHELAHYIYHKEYFSGSSQSPALNKGDEYVEDDDIEREANMLCSYILIPTGQMKKAYYRLMASGNQSTIVTNMAALFGVACKTMEIRMREHGLIN